jgi:membrane dipeptidase
VPEAAARATEGMALYRELKAKYGDDTKTIRAEMKAWYTRHPTPPASVHVVLDHIDHIAKVAGVDHVGLGSDFDGVTSVPVQLEDVSCYPNITQGLLDRGYSPADIKKILGANLLRALRAAELARAN